jgi:hypothetical protein
MRYKERSTDTLFESTTNRRSKTLDRRGSKTKTNSTSLNRPTSSHDLSSTLQYKSDRRRNLRTGQTETQASMHSLLSAKSVSIHPEVTQYNYDQYGDR